MKLAYSFCILFLFSMGLFAQESVVGNACIACEELKKQALPEVKILETAWVEEESNYCKVLGRIGKEINFELLLPEKWNERFVMGGGGGFVGSIQNMARGKVHEGYATSGTDTGHQGPGIKADWAYNNLERQVNFAHLAVHRTAVVSKALIYQYYCKAATYNYFMGCSRGGGQALIEAQRYPEDFDGIVAMAPIIDWPATGAEFIQNTQLLFPDPENRKTASLSPQHLSMLQKAVLDQCDELDGVADGFLNDPRDCKIDYTTLAACPLNEANEDCFTSDQIRIIKGIYEGLSIEGEKIYPGFPPGCENEAGGWPAWITGPNQGTMALNYPSLHFAFGTEMFKYLLFNDPDWDYSTYDFTNFEKDAQLAKASYNATNTDYSAFKARGGKLIIPHGWNDPALSAYTAIEHIEAVKEGDEEVADYMRLFLIPGMLHCGGGPGPSEADWLELVRDWVEDEKVPEKVIVSKKQKGEIKMSRPLFPYPDKAIYKGEGDSNLESSFKRGKQ